MMDGIPQLKVLAGGIDYVFKVDNFMELYLLSCTCLAVSLWFQCLGLRWPQACESVIVGACKEGGKWQVFSDIERKCLKVLSVVHVTYQDTQNRTSVALGIKI